MEGVYLPKSRRPRVSLDERAGNILGRGASDLLTQLKASIRRDVGFDEKAVERKARGILHKCSLIKGTDRMERRRAYVRACISPAKRHLIDWDSYPADYDGSLAPPDDPDPWSDAVAAYAKRMGVKKRKAQVEALEVLAVISRSHADLEDARERTARIMTNAAEKRYPRAYLAKVMDNERRS